eukprot:2777372-Heterocapsa_arctica.AAC.1
MPIICGFMPSIWPCCASSWKVAAAESISTKIPIEAAAAKRISTKIPIEAAAAKRAAEDDGSFSR